MEPGAELAQRQVELGREHEHRQPGLQPEPAADEAHADGDRDERDAERRRQLQHRARQEADAQRPHRRAPVAVADRRKRRRLLAAAVERPQRRQPADDVEEVRREQPQRLPALDRPLLRVAADEPHEHRHERQRREHQRGRAEVDRGHPAEHGERHDACEHDLRQVAGEVALERVDALHRGRRDLARLGAVERERSGAQAPLDEREPQLGEDAGGGAPAGDLGRPRERAAAGERQREEHEVGASRPPRSRRRTPARRSARAASPGRARAAPSRRRSPCRPRAGPAPPGPGAAGAGRAPARSAARLPSGAPLERLERRRRLLAGQAVAEDGVAPRPGRAGRRARRPARRC